MENIYNYTKFTNVSRVKLAVYPLYFTGNIDVSTAVHRKPRKKYCTDCDCACLLLMCMCPRTDFLVVVVAWGLMVVQISFMVHHRLKLNNTADTADFLLLALC